MDDVIRTFNTYLFEDKLRERMQYEEILKTEYGIAFDQTPTLDAEHLLPIYDFEGVGMIQNLLYHTWFYIFW